MKKLYLLWIFLLWPGVTWGGAKNFKGQIPPEISPKQWANTQPLNWSNLRGKVVFLEFFESW